MLRPSRALAPLLVLFLFLSLAAPALGQPVDHAPADDVERTVEVGIELFGGYAQREFFNSGHGGAGLAFRIRDVVTLRTRLQFFGAANTSSGPGAPDEALSGTFGIVVHPFKFYNGQVPKFWLEPYFATDVGAGGLIDGDDGGEFLQADFLWGLNFLVGRPLVIFFEGGVLYLDFDDNDAQSDLAVQGEFQGGIRYFF